MKIMNASNTLTFSSVIDGFSFVGTGAVLTEL
jgi:hypothetical protein